jgi:hypothetical protein
MRGIAYTGAFKSLYLCIKEAGMQRRFFVESRVLALMLSIGLFLSFPVEAQAPNPVGEWNLQTDAQGTVTNFTLTITKEGETFKGKVASELYGAQELTDLKFANGTLTYTRNLEIGGQAVSMAFSGKIESDKMTGAYNLEGIELPVTGTRKKPAAAPTPAAK